MFRRTTLPRVLTGALVAAALAAPVAQSRPIDTPLAAAQPMDTHASVAESLAAKQDLRSPDARDAATRQAPPAGQPTWPVDPQPIAAPASEPVAVDSGSPVPVVPIVAGALLVLLAALIARYTARRMGRNTRVAA